MRSLWTFVAATTLASVLLADSAAAQAKLAANTEVKPFQVYGVTGQFDNKQVELAKPTDHPQVYLFVAADKFDRPTARYLKTFDSQVLKGIEGVKSLDVYAVWLTEEPQKSKDYLPKAQQSLQLGQTSLAVFEGAKQGPTGWEIDPDAYLTTIVVRDGKVVESFVYRSTNEADVPALVEALKKKP